MQAHLDTEKHLKAAAHSDSSFTYTAIREGLYSESTAIYTAFPNLNDPESSGEITIPHDGQGPGISWVKLRRARRGICEADCPICQRPSPFSLYQHKGDPDRITGMVSCGDCRCSGSAHGKSLKIRQVSVDEYCQLPQVLARFGSDPKARTWATAWDAIRAGETAVVTGDLEKILGRRPEEFEKTVQNHRK